MGVGGGVWRTVGGGEGASIGVRGWLGKSARLGGARGGIASTSRYLTRHSGSVRLARHRQTVGQDAVGGRGMVVSSGRAHFSALGSRPLADRNQKRASFKYKI